MRILFTGFRTIAAVILFISIEVLAGHYSDYIILLAKPHIPMIPKRIALIWVILSGRDTRVLWDCNLSHYPSSSIPQTLVHLAGRPESIISGCHTNQRRIRYIFRDTNCRRISHIAECDTRTGEVGDIPITVQNIILSICDIDNYIVVSSIDFIDLS